MPVKRWYSIPERLATAGYVAGISAAVYPLASEAAGFGVPCPLRILTGIPCPGCGLTTGAIALVSGRLQQAVEANPVIVVMALLAVSMAPVLALRFMGLLPSPKPVLAATRQKIELMAIAAAAASWLFQLDRFELI